MTQAYSLTSRRVARFAVTPEFLIGMMKHGIGEAVIVENAIPPDARFGGMFIDGGLIWINVESREFAELDHGQVIPELPKTVFEKVRRPCRTTK